MIRKAQAKFIAIIMAIIMSFFIIIFGASYIVLLNANQRAVDLELENIEQSFKQVISLNQEGRKIEVICENDRRYFFEI